MKAARLMIGSVVVLALAGGGWWFFGGGKSGGGMTSNGDFTVKWRGKEAGAMTLPATLNWCPITRVGVLEAISGDSGIAVVLYEVESLTNGPHTVVSPDMGATAPKPGASFVMRWIRIKPDTVVVGFRSETGTARIQIARGMASGDINARMRAVTGTDTLVAQGSFRGVPVVTTAKGCT